MEYLISFSSFYKAAYAEEKLYENGINSSMRKLPQELLNSCSTGLYIRTESIERVQQVLESAEIYPRGIYRMDRDEKGAKKLFRLA